ncbi:ribonuclease HIII [Bacillus sp. FJAT-47783]|uniref:ribonuclease HIII n=1 Tax=Bacillus sp. FJAT-47783 TaxID=2922712 RepID=UPI001FAD0C5F|nr:ribonuclease HIII [Bacillus sp. FJAT-47783]
MSNCVIKVNKTSMEQINEHYKPYFHDKVPQGALFTAKVDGCTITAYHSGKVLFQGPKSEIEAAKWGEKEASKPKQSKHLNESSPYQPPNNISSMSVIGSDEVGTGDYFGPITVTAVYVDKENIHALKQLGVKDSKNLSDTHIRTIAQKLIHKVPYSLLILHNEKYNELQKKGMSQGKMKAVLHNQAINHVRKKIAPTIPEAVLIDQFVQPDIYFRHNINKEIPLKNRTYFSTKAEGIHIAVACASIISRYAFLKEMDKLSAEAEFTLPKGAGHKVDEAGAKLIKLKGEKSLYHFTKYHFANTEKAKKLFYKQ